ncbi:SIR2 family protein [Brassicibacter mesophilus]|uniref:SIR2 family protein n=1 Tax=Brassicibacter mesophilus TaxID=745119 RepID=UPI003D2294E4
MDIQQFLDELTEEILINNKKITFFIGAGFSVWFGYPSWNGLLYDFCNKLAAEDILQKDFLSNCKDKVDKGYPIPKAFHDILTELNLDIDYLRDFVIEHFREIERINKDKKFREDTIDFMKYKELIELGKTSKIITTNFDTLIEDVILEKFNIKSKVFYSDTNKLNKKFFLQNKNEYSILKLHGDINKKDSMIISQQDYEEMVSHSKYKLVRQALKNDFSTNITIFIGYSIRDENIKQLLIDNNDTYGEDKEKSYIINLKESREVFLIEEGFKESDSRYIEMGVQEIFVSIYDELLTVLRHLNCLIKLKEKHLDKNKIITSFRNQQVTNKFQIWDGFQFSLSLYKNSYYKECQKILEKVIEKYQGDKNTRWEYIYSMMGVLYECSEDKFIKNKGKEYLDKAIEISQNIDEIYSNIGNLYLGRAVVRKYESDISHNLGIIRITNKGMATKALNYFMKIEDKNEYIKYMIVDCLQKSGKIDQAIKLGQEYKEESNYYPRIDLVLALIYFNKAQDLIYTEEKEKLQDRKEYYIKSYNLFKYFMKSKKYTNETKESKIQILNGYCQCLIELGMYEELNIHCKELLKIEPAENNVHRYIIYMYINQKQYDKAIEECDYEIEHTKDMGGNLLKVKYIKAQCIHASAIFTHQVFEAINICKEILEKREYFDVTYSISRMYQTIGRFKEMKEYVVKSCYIYPLEEGVYKLAQDLLSGHFQGEEKEFDVRQAMEDMGKLHQYKVEFTKKQNIKDRRKYYLYKDMGLTTSRKTKRIMIEDNITLKDFLLGVLKSSVTNETKEKLDKAFHYYTIKEYNKVYEIIQTYKDLYWENHIFKYVYTNTLANTNNKDEALSIYENILESEMEYYNDSQKKLIHFYCGDCYFAKGDCIKAHEQYSESYKIDVKFANALFKLGEVKYKLALLNINSDVFIQLLAGSELCFKEYIKLDSYTWEAYANLAIIQYSLGKLADMVDTSIKLTGFILQPNLQVVNYNRILFGYLLLEDDESVKKYIDRFENIICSLDLSRVHKNNIYLYYQYKGYYYSNYSYEEAVKAFEDAYGIYPTEENKRRLETVREPGSTHYLEFGDKTIVRGGAKPKEIILKKLT